MVLPTNDATVVPMICDRAASTVARSISGRFFGCTRGGNCATTVGKELPLKYSSVYPHSPPKVTCRGVLWFRETTSKAYRGGARPRLPLSAFEESRLHSGKG